MEQKYQKMLPGIEKCGRKRYNTKCRKTKKREGDSYEKKSIGNDVISNAASIRMWKPGGSSA